MTKTQPEQETSETVEDAAMNLASQLSLQDTTNQPLADVNTSLETSENGSKSLLQAVEELGNKADALKKAIEQEGKAAREADKMRRIEFALQNMSLVNQGFPFKWYTKNSSATKRTSRSTYKIVQGHPITLFQNILLSFHQGTGWYVANCFIDENSLLGDGATAEVSHIEEEWKQSFLDKLLLRLHKLVGTKPRFSVEDGKVYDS